MLPSLLMAAMVAKDLFVPVTAAEAIMGDTGPDAGTMEELRLPKDQ
jgi:hypothetical protein